MALMHCGQCVPVRALGRRWDATHVIVYLPFHFQMALSGENVLLDTLSLSLALSPSPHSFPFHHPSRGSLRYVDCVSGPEHAA